MWTFCELTDTKELCYLCRELLCGPSYICEEHGFFLHETCAKFPLYKIQSHPFHPDHPLSFLDRSLNKDENFICSGCREIKQGSSFCCKVCEFKLDFKCARLVNSFFSKSDLQVLEERERKGKIDHFCHKHVLDLCYVRKEAETLCSCCNELICGSAYCCLDCEFFIHEACKDQMLPKVTLQPCYSLVVHAMDAHESGTCGACGNAIKGISLTEGDYHNPFHYSCAQLFSPRPCSIYGQFNSHLFYFKHGNISGNRNCSVFSMKPKCKHNVSAVVCSLRYPESYHVRCILPCVVKHRYHDCDLILLDSIRNYDLLDYRCDICEDIGNPMHHVYCCEDCNFNAHIECVISEDVISAEMPFSDNVDVNGMREVDGEIEQERDGEGCAFDQEAQTTMKVGTSEEKLLSLSPIESFETIGEHMGDIAKDATDSSSDKTTGGNVFTKKIRGIIVWNKETDVETTNSQLAEIDDLGGRLHKSGVSLQLLCAVSASPGDDDLQVKVGDPAYLEEWIAAISTLTPGESVFKVIFDWDVNVGVPEAFIVRISSHKRFYLKTLVLDDIPGQGRIQFCCDTWVYPVKHHHPIFFREKYSGKLNRTLLGNIAYKSTAGIYSLNKKHVQGKVVLIEKNVSDSNNVEPSLLDHLHEVLFQLVSAVNGDSENGDRGKVGEPLEDAISSIKPLGHYGECEVIVNFDWDEGIGVPGAFIIRNNSHSEFYLKSLTLEDIPGQGRIHFVCNSWVYPAKYYKNNRVFFANQTYLPINTPGPLCYYREQELVELRGDGKGELQEWDRVYDYAYYNDLGHPDKGAKYVRPVLGGSAMYPYPRRGRTGRPPAISDHCTESKLPHPLRLNIYVPRDEQFSQLKMSDFFAYGLKIIDNLMKIPSEDAESNPIDFESFEDVLKLFQDGIHLHCRLADYELGFPFVLKDTFRTYGRELFKFPIPGVIKEGLNAWRTDEEFAREMLSGVNPIIIRCLEDFPPMTKLNHKLYGNHNSTITANHIDNNLDGLTIGEAIKNNKLFILDHHDALMPCLRRINTSTPIKTYASRTILFLKDDGTLKPLAIELSLPHPDGDQFGAVSEVYTPSEHGVEGSFWMLAKAYVIVNDSAIHHLGSHWLNTHAVIEPFIIATNRQLSALHPIHKLLHPHFRNTMFINAISRLTLINAGGLLEMTVFPGKYSLEISSMLYKNWVFTEQALPEDLKKRGLAVEDPNSPHILRLLIQDYPYAVDGLEIWSAIKKWVEDYCLFYYKSDEMVQKDTELQSWWKELREEGHGDKKDEPWWPKMQTCEELIDSCTIIIWIASALHTAVNFGQYALGGYIANRPTISRRLMPEVGTPEYSELESDPEKAFFKTVPSVVQTVLMTALTEILSRHSSDEVYIGQRDTSEWTSDPAPLQAFTEFGNKLVQIEDRIMARNHDWNLKNRVGPVMMPYTLLYPSTSNISKDTGLTGKGIPNSISI